jgi:hypothetical protein
MSIMQRLYGSEISAIVYSFRDCGFCLYLGDELNGYRAEGQRSSWAEVERWLDEQDRIHYRTASTHAP